MLKINLIALTAAATIFAATTSNADECIVEDAEARLNEASEAGIVQGVGFVNDLPTIAVDPETWAMMPIDARVGMIETVECAAAGPGKILAKVQIIAPTGKVLANFDGMSRHLEVTE
jgi:hypothetical protein